MAYTSPQPRTLQSILKVAIPLRTNTTTPPPQVHFPPSPRLPPVYPAHSAKAYDRSAIVVQPNPCALPERGSRVYSPEATPKRKNDTLRVETAFPASVSNGRRPRTPYPTASAAGLLTPPALVADDSESEDFSDNERRDRMYALPGHTSRSKLQSPPPNVVAMPIPFHDLARKVASPGGKARLQVSVGVKPASPAPPTRNGELTLPTSLAMLHADHAAMHPSTSPPTSTRRSTDKRVSFTAAYITRSANNNLPCLGGF